MIDIIQRTRNPRNEVLVDKRIEKLEGWEATRL